MMEAKAIAKQVRIAPQKAMRIADLVRGKGIREAYAILKFTPHKACGLIEKVLKSAIANAEHNYEMDKDSLYVSKITIDEGPTMKRFKPRAMGRADVMRRRTSHITVAVSQKEV
jgi:large subunit ribosomal protein L22